MSHGSSYPCPRCKADNPAPAEFCVLCGFGLEETGTISAVDSDVNDPERWVGRIIAEKYKVLSVLGEGGFGIVFKVQLTLLDETSIFALKMLRPDLSRNESFRRRFLREARTAMGLVHPYAIPVREFGQTEDQLLFFTMDFCPGEPLQQVLAREGYMTVNRAIPLAMQMLEVMEAAHAREIIHRDLKPDNVFVERDPGSGREEVRIGDFGLAKSVGREAARLGSDITKGGIVGTPRYMSPEQARGEPLDSRSDLYSIGVMLFEMVSGQLPPRPATKRGFLGAGDDTALARVREMIPPNLVVPRGVLEVLVRALEEKPSGRYQTAREFREALECLPNYTPTYIEPRRPRPRRTTRRWARVAALIVVGCGVALAFPETRTELSRLAQSWQLAAAPGEDRDQETGRPATEAAPEAGKEATEGTNRVDGGTESATALWDGGVEAWVPLAAGQSVAFRTTVTDAGARREQYALGEWKADHGFRLQPESRGEGEGTNPEWWLVEQDGFYKVWALDTEDGTVQRKPELRWDLEEGRPMSSWTWKNWTYKVPDERNDVVADHRSYRDCLVVVATRGDQRKVSYFHRGTGLVLFESSKSDELLMRQERLARD